MFVSTMLTVLTGVSDVGKFAVFTGLVFIFVG